MKILIANIVLLTVSAVVLAQGESVTAEADFLGSPAAAVVRLPVPVYPAGAKRAFLGGRVSVAVTLDDRGTVVSADDTDGPYPVCRAVTDANVLALRTAALEAARRAVFKPAMIGSQPAWTKGRIVYNFTPPAKPIETGATEDLGVSFAPGAVGVDSRGGLNNKAIELPRPSVSRAAKAAGATGAVKVEILIIEDGSVYSATAVSGHPLLHPASEIAACGARFIPTLLSGRPVKVTGVITYNFAP